VSPAILAPLVEVRDLAVRRGGRAVLSVDSLDIHHGETLAVIGPNGAGKSTLLLCLARLLKPHAGTIRFRGLALEEMDDLAYRRRIALVLQEPLLLDRKVFDNVAAPLRFRGLSREVIQRRARHWLDRLGIGALHARSARGLSGGEAQRLSLARALVLEPELLLLDEPFSALDAPTRLRLLDDLRVLLAENPVTAVFVTHDQNEALALGDRVAVVLEGKLRQVGAPAQVFGAPVDEAVAGFVGVETVLPGQVCVVQDGQVTVSVYGEAVYAVGTHHLGQSVLACLRPEDITLWRVEHMPASSARNRLHGVIVRVSPQGPMSRIEVACGQDPATSFNLVALVTRHSVAEMALAPGVGVIASFKASAVHLIAR
jgi:tungstate transport system ATP-binding protein